MFLVDGRCGVKTLSNNQAVQFIIHHKTVRKSEVKNASKFVGISSKRFVVPGQKAGFAAIAVIALSIQVPVSAGTMRCLGVLNPRRVVGVNVFR